MSRERGVNVVQAAAGTQSQSLRSLSNEELSDIIAKCENAIADGTAEIEDFEAFVLCQKELARRTWA